ncbi:hypothetical protein [Ideonella sp.]|jgi:hypothetical protein|uniref:hypothetical protein n=1 Tax=Ideonella sp. TaxID=1929293 RepID=UPI0037BFC9D6
MTSRLTISLLMGALFMAAAIGMFVAHRFTQHERTFIEPVIIPIASTTAAESKTPLLLRLQGEVDGLQVAVDIQLGTLWRRQLDKLDDPLPSVESFWGTVELHRLGPESDALLAVLEQRFGLADSAGKLRPIVSAEAVSFNGHPLSSTKSQLNLKLFLGQPATDSYAELFLTLDRQRQFAKIHEKNREYRQSLLRELRQ